MRVEHACDAGHIERVRCVSARRAEEIARHILDFVARHPVGRNDQEER
jgi:hypothetical protein